MPKILCAFLILFLPCIVTIIARLQQRLYAIYVKSQVIRIHEMFLRASEINHHPQGDVNACKNVDVLGNIMPSHSSIKFVDVPLFIVCVVVRIRTSRFEFFDPTESSSFVML